MPVLKLSYLLLGAGIPLVILGIAGLSYQLAVRSAYSRAADRHEIIFVNAHRRINGLKPHRRSLAQVALPAIALVLGLFLTAAGSLSLAGLASDPVWAFAKPTPTPTPTPTTRKPSPQQIVLRVGCYNQYMYFKSKSDGKSLKKVDCSSKAARSEVIKSTADSACEEKAGWVYNPPHTARSYCVRPVFRKGLCLPTWKEKSDTSSYFSHARSCKDPKPSLKRPAGVGKAAKYGYLKIKSVHKYKTDGWVCDGDSYRYNVKRIKKTVCTSTKLT